MMQAVAIPPFERFYEEHRSEVLRLLRRRLGADRAEDAFQETFLRALRAYGRLEHGEHLRAWVLTIAQNVALDTLRRARPTDELVETARRRRAARLRGARRAHRRPRPEGASCRRAPLRLRPLVRPDRVRARLEPRRGPTGHVHGRSTHSKEDRLMTVSPDLDRRFRDAAATLGLIDVGFDVVDSPIGPLLVAASDRGLATISFDAEPDAQLERLARIAGPRVLRSPRSVDAARRELDEYFARRAAAPSTSRSTSGAAAVHARGPRRARARALRRDDDVRRARRARRPPARRARRRHGDEPQPHPDRPPVPPRRRLERRPHRATRAASTAS